MIEESKQIVPDQTASRGESLEEQYDLGLLCLHLWASVRFGSGIQRIHRMCRPLVRVCNRKIFFLFLNQNIYYNKGTQKNRLNEMVLLSTQNIC